MKDNFNNQFATQKLREDDYAKHGVKPFNPATEQMGKMVATVDIPRLGISAGREYPMSKTQFDQVMKKLQLLGDTEEMQSVTFVNTSLEEECSVTTAGEGSSTFEGNIGEQPAPRATRKKVVRKNLNAEVADVETRLAAGEADNYAVDHWGWEEAPSIPNRPSEMFDYRKIYEGLGVPKMSVGTIGLGKGRNGIYIVTDEGKFVYEPDPSEFKAFELSGKEVRLLLAKSWLSKAEPYTPDYSPMASLGQGKGPHIDEELNENYSRFRNETKTRTKEQQFHTAVRLAEKKILEANRILEYTAQLKGELNEVRVGKHTQKLMERITRSIAEAYGKMKKLK